MLADSPSIELVEPSGVVQASVGSSRVLRCRAEGRPAPAYQWLHQQGPGGQVEVVAASRDLELQTLGYREAGDYICRVTNTISGEERSAESEVITIQVEGEPQLLGEASVVASTGDTALQRPARHHHHLAVGPGGAGARGLRGHQIQVQTWHSGRSESSHGSFVPRQLFVNCFLIFAAWQG